MQSFPQPPSAKEEKEYLRRCRAGDKEARNALIERNLRLVAYIAKKYAALDKDMEDLVSIGTIGLIKAVDSFDESKKIRLASYASRCIENELLMNFRARKKTARDVYLYDSIGSDKEGNEIQLLDVIESGAPEALEQIGLKDDTAKMYRLLEEVLTPRERKVLIMRYGLYHGREYTQREIAQKLGISRSYISRIEKNALTRLRACFED